jgi:DNA-binding CsgD family transcriptional regulator
MEIDITRDTSTPRPPRSRRCEWRVSTDRGLPQPRPLSGTRDQVIQSISGGALRSNREFIESVERIPDGELCVMPRVLPALAKLLGVNKLVSYGLRSDLDGPALDWGAAASTAAYGLSEADTPRIMADLTAAIRKTDAPFLTFDPTRPARAVRNRVQIVSHSKLTETGQAFAARYGYVGDEHMSVVICEGISVLAIVDAMRDKPFSTREVRTLQALLPCLRKRLLVERHLRRVPVLHLVEPALEAIGAPVFLFRGQTILYANAAAKAALDGNRTQVIACLCDHLAGRATGRFQLTRHVSRGVPDHVLAVGVCAPEDPAPRAKAIASHWRLGRRSAETLTLVAQGFSNKEIAAILKCAVGTVEFHVTALLHRAQCNGRAALVARFWTFRG